MRRSPAAALLLLTLLVSAGCRRETAKPPPPPPPADEQVYAPRPSAPLGVYVGLFLAQNGFLPVNGAMQGVVAGRELMTVDPKKNLEETFALLQEFGAVLGENIPDLLNRSDDRPNTLTLYQQGLQNITERAKRREAELQSALEDLRRRENEASRTIGDIERSLREALEKRDYATSGGLQQERTVVEDERGRLQTEINQTQDILRTFEDLLRIAEKRIDAIQKNREALIAGIKVSDVPGVEDLGVINKETERSTRRSNFNFDDL